jgi:hypothetical protein
MLDITLNPELLRLNDLRNFRLLAIFLVRLQAQFSFGRALL